MGNATPEGASESAFDLFDRWLAHHDQESADVAGAEHAAGPLRVATTDDQIPTSAAGGPAAGAAEDRQEPDAARVVVAAMAASTVGLVTPPKPSAQVGVAQRGVAAVARTTPDRRAVIAEPLPSIAAPRTGSPVTTVAPARPSRRSPSGAASLRSCAPAAGTASTRVLRHCRPVG